MQRRRVVSAMIASALAGPVISAGLADLSESDAVLGVRTALERGATVAVGLLGRVDGFLGNPKVRIPLPGFLDEAAEWLRAVGQGKRIDALLTAMNRAAESAVAEAKPLLVAAVRSMSVEDARRVLAGGQDSVTQFFAAKTREPLGVKFLPIVTRATERVALADKYNALASRASHLGLTKKEDANLQQYVTGKALDGLYLMIGEEERKLRADPVSAGSAILRKVFGSLK